jgi:hypothetical protein
MAFAIVAESCEEAPRPFIAAHAMLALNPKLAVMLGDDPYYNIALTWAGRTTSRITTTSTSANVKDRVHAMFNKPGWREFLAYRAAGNMLVSWAGGDDHRWADSADHTVAAAQSGAGPTGAVTQADVNAIATVWYTAHRELANTYWDYPTSASLNSNNGDVPSAPAAGGAAMAASAFPVIYHYLDYDINGNQGGAHVRVIVPDLITYRSPIGATDDGSKVCMGAAQKVWFMEAVRSAWLAGFKHILICSSKKLYAKDSSGRYGGGENSDTWGAYATERDDIFGTLHAEGIRVVQISGDRHTPNVVRRTVADHAAAFDCLDLCSCPSGVANNDTGQGDTIGQLWLRSSPAKFESVFGSAQFEDDGRLRVAIRDARSGLIRWACWVAPRSNTPLYA